MKITRKKLEKIIKEELTAVMTPDGGGGDGGANDAWRKKYIKAVIEMIRDKINPLLSVEDVALHIQYDNFGDWVMDITHTYEAGEQLSSDEEHDFDAGRRWNAEMLKKAVLSLLPKKSVARMVVWGFDADSMQQHIEQIAGNAG